MRFRLSPDVTIALGARVKRPGDEMVGDQTELRSSTSRSGDELDAYERLLGDAMDGDPTLFARQDGVEAAWAVVDNVLGNVTPVHEYDARIVGTLTGEPADERKPRVAQSGAVWPVAAGLGARDSGLGAPKRTRNLEPGTRNPEPFIRSPHPSPSSPHSRPQHPPSAARSRESSNCRTPFC